MSLYISPLAAEQLHKMEEDSSLMETGLYEILKNINLDGFDKSSYKITKLEFEDDEVIYVLRHHLLRLFLTKNEDEIVLIDIINKKNPRKG